LTGGRSTTGAGTGATLPRPVDLPTGAFDAKGTAAFDATGAAAFDATGAVAFDTTGAGAFDTTGAGVFRTTGGVVFDATGAAAFDATGAAFVPVADAFDATGAAFTADDFTGCWTVFPVTGFDFVLTCTDLGATDFVEPFDLLGGVTGLFPVFVLPESLTGDLDGFAGEGFFALVLATCSLAPFGPNRADKT